MPKAQWFIEKEDGLTEGPFIPATAWEEYRWMPCAIAIVHPPSGLKIAMGDRRIACPECESPDRVGVIRVQRNPDRWVLRCGECGKSFIPKDQQKKRGRPLKYGDRPRTNTEYSRIRRARLREEDKSEEDNE